jgi:hypothetical protein
MSKGNDILVEQKVTDIMDVIPLGHLIKNYQTTISGKILGRVLGYEIGFKTGPSIDLIKHDMESVEEFIAKVKKEINS